MNEKPKPEAPHYSEESAQFGCGSCLIGIGILLAIFLYAATSMMEAIAPGSVF